MSTLHNVGLRVKSVVRKRHSQIMMSLSALVLGISFFGARAYGLRPAAVDVTAQRDITSELLRVHKHVGVQAGYWKNSELPAELEALRSKTGMSAGGYSEEEINLTLARDVVLILRNAGVVTDLLPATIPSGYTADAFVASYTDGNTNTTMRGYKVAASKWGESTKAQLLADQISKEYGLQSSYGVDTANLPDDAMHEYYAFNYGTYTASINPKTPAAIVEAGYISNKDDRFFLTKLNDTAAHGLANGILKYLVL
jgi:hypothetical protein